MAATLDVAERASGTNTGFRQITDTVFFEIKRNLKKLVIFCFAEVILFTILALVYETFISNGVMLLPEDPKNFSRFFFLSFSSVSYINWYICIVAVMLGAPSIALDFEKQTGHQLFPRVSRGRLLAGRVIGLYILLAIFLSLYYVLIGIYTAIKYDGDVPVEFVWSLGFALFYGLAVLSYVIFLSTLMKNTGGAFGLGIGSLLVIFMLLETLIPLIFKIEPIFILSYYFSILPNIFNMPTSNCVEGPNIFRPSMTSLICSTPTVEGALLGMLVYTVACLSLAYIRFRKRQLIS